jgi:hypothetical protein
MTKYVQVANGAVTTVYGGPQAITTDKPGYQVIEDTDPLWTAWLASQAAQATLAEAQAQFVLAGSAGVAITSTSTPALNANYGCQAQDEINLIGLQASILAGVPWLGYYRNIAGAKVMMTAAQFTAVATAILNFIAAADNAFETAAAGGSASWPAATATIA